MGMESAAEFWNKIDADKELQEALFSTVKQADGEQVVAFAKEHGFDFTVDDLRQLAEAADKPDLSDADLDNVVGGFAFQNLKLGDTSRFVLSRLSRGLRSSAGPAPL